MRTRGLLSILIVAWTAAQVFPAARAQTEIPTCFGEQATIVGTPGDDDGNTNPMLEGTSGPDVIVGLGGRDFIDGNGGDDRICGNAGPDWIDMHEDAAEGNDHLSGGGGPDRMIGSWEEVAETAVNDILKGGAQNDQLTGGQGRDYVAGGSGDDHMFGGSGDDRVRGGTGDDIVNDQPTLNPGDDSDLLFGNLGDDQLYGDDGDGLDTLDAGSQVNYDVCYPDVSPAADTLVDCEVIA